jgi:hypothetical protein
MMLAQSTLSTITDHISKALQDNEISDEEFTLILSEIDKNNLLKEGIRNKTKSKLDEATKESLIKQGKEKATEEFSTMFGARGKKSVLRLIIILFLRLNFKYHCKA